MRRAVLALVACLIVCMLAACGTHKTSSTHTQAAMGSVHPAGWGAPVWGNRLAATAPAATREMFDTITLSTVPANPFALAGYTAGFWPTYLPLRHAFPQAHTLSVAISAAYHADCLDVESGDAIPSQVVGWIYADIKAGFPHPCVYSSLWEYVNQIRPLLAAAHVPRSLVFEWDADYTYVQHLDPSFDATQWTDKAFGRNLDESTVTLPFLSIAQPPYIAPKPKPKPASVVCFTHRLSPSACAQVKAKVAGDNRAVIASWRAWHSLNCPRYLRRRNGRWIGVGPYVRIGCAELAHRAHYFAAKARALEAAS